MGMDGEPAEPFGADVFVPLLECQVLRRTRIEIGEVEEEPHVTAIDRRAQPARDASKPGNTSLTLLNSRYSQRNAAGCACGVARLHKPVITFWESRLRVGYSFFA